LREISRGLHPAILSEAGWAQRSIRSPTIQRPIELHLGVDDRLLPHSVEVAAYYVVAEALTNTAKHAQSSEVNVRADTDGANLRLSIPDDGIGGAAFTKGSGTVGLHDRVEALGGRVQISSVARSGTSRVVTVPFGFEWRTAH
jgi:signal transduction histidine kinase